MGLDFGFMTRFWISTTELFVIMNSFLITERNESMDLSMDMWHSNNMKVILCKFAKDDCLNTELCSLFLFFFICIDSFHMAQNQANWFKILFSNFWKTWSNLYLCRRGPTKSVLFINSSFCLSVCLSVTHFSQDLLSG